METEKNKRKIQKTILIVLSILLVLSAIFTATYALFYTETVAPNPSDYSTGLLSITAVSKSDNISLENTLPMEDTEGEETGPYVFTIKNNGNVDYQFDIKLLSTNDNPINSQYIRIKVDDEDTTTLSSFPNSINNGNTVFIIKSGVLEAKKSIDVTLRVWLASNTPNSEIGKTFNSKLVVNGQAIYTETNYDAYDGAARQIYEMFNKTTTITNNCNTFEEIDTYNQLIKDPLGNLHYYGQEPNNYIDIEDNVLWRIIGVVDGRLKLIRSSIIGKFSWDVSQDTINSGYGINEWSQADLMKLLNPGYENESVGGSLYWNSQKGDCYTSQNNHADKCDFTSTGLKSSAKNKIATVTWYLGGGSNADIYSCQALTMERGNNVISNPLDGITRTTSWNGKVAVPYPSDYAYATDLSQCNQTLTNYNSDDNSYACRTNNWMWYLVTERASDSPHSAWLLTPLVSSNASEDHHAWTIGTTGEVLSNYKTSTMTAVAPVLYLESNQVIESGTGTENDPYIINSN